MIDRLGRFSAILLILLSLLAFAIVILRYVFNLGWVSLQEVIIYLHAIAFLLAAPFTLKNDGHVRVDVLYARLTKTKKSALQIAGILLLYMPMFFLLLYYCWPYVMDSWAVKESSGDAGGLPFLYLLKSFLLIFPIIMIWQGIFWLKDSLKSLAGPE